MEIGDADSIPSMFHLRQSAAAQDESGPMVVSSKKRPVLKDENRYDLFVKAISGSIAQAEPHLTQTQRMKRVGQVWKQLAVEERLKIIQEHKVKMDAMGVKDRALVDAGPMIQVCGLKRRAKERYEATILRISSPFRTCMQDRAPWGHGVVALTAGGGDCMSAGGYLPSTFSSKKGWHSCDWKIPVWSTKSA